MIFSIDTIGLLAAVLTTLCWLPQAIKTLRTKETKALSAITQSAFAVGVGLWLVYGLFIGNLPLIIANSITFVLAALILYLKLRYR